MKRLAAVLPLFLLAQAAHAELVTTPLGVSAAAVIGSCGASSNQLLWDNGGACAGLATANNGVLITSGGGVPSISSTLPSALTIPSPGFTGTVTGNGTIPNAVLANSSMTIAGHSIALGGTQTIACADLSNGATGCSTSTGTSGATIPLLNGANTWSGSNTFATASFKVGDGTFSLSAAINGPASGTGAGAGLAIQAGGSTVAAFTTYSLLNGSTFDSTPTFYSVSNAFRFQSLTQSAAAQSGTVCYNTSKGDITYDATLGCLASSGRFKNIIGRLSPNESLSIVSQFSGAVFTKKLDDGGDSDPNEQIGLIAEEVAAIDPRLVAYGTDGKVRGVRYAQDMAIYAGAIQALEARIKTLERK